jgi:hypothetical protein
VPRINALLIQAMANLCVHRAMHGQVELREHRWSALYLPLAALLGKELTKCMRQTGELRHDYRYVGDVYTGDRTNDHVVPLKCIVERLIECAKEWTGAAEDVTQLRCFLSEHLLMADIPKTLNQDLARDSMPNQDWWKPAVAGFSEQSKQEALWGRYIASANGLVIPSSGDVDFVRVRRQ